MLATSSQEVKFLVQWTHLGLDSLLKALMLLTTREVELSLGDTDCSEEIGDFVCVLARGRHLDWASPVEIEVAQSVGELLQFQPVQWRVIATHIEMGRQHAALVR